MATNDIILIDDSSEDEVSPSKIPKICRKTKENSLKDLKIVNIKSLSSYDDVMILDDIEVKENNDNLQNSFNDEIDLTEEHVKNYKNCEKLVILEDNEKPIHNEDKESSNDKENIEIFKNHEKDNLILNLENNEKSVINEDFSPSCSKTSEEFDVFLQACVECTYEAKYKDIILKKLPKIRQMYNEADENFVNSTRFKEYLATNTDNIKKKPNDTIIIFSNILKELKTNKKDTLELSERHEKHLKKLSSTLRKVNKRIKKLEVKEVDFDDENNSSYIQLERYKERSCSIYKKMCELMKKSHLSCRFIYGNLKCNSSQYSEINNAINKLYNKKKTFLTCYEVDQCIRKCVSDHNINLSEDMLKIEIKKTFTEVGKILQRRRKRELYDSLNSFIEGSDPDPADIDSELNDLLKERHVQFENSLNQVLQKYVDYEEKGENPELSSDSDDSHYVSESEETVS